MKKMVLIDSTIINESFKDGKPKRTGKVKMYEYDQYVYELNVGEHVRYYKGGSRTVSIYDDWGTELITRYYDSESYMMMEYITTEIEANTENITDFLGTNKYVTYKVYFKEFQYDYKLCAYYLKKTGQYTNGKKAGKWHYFLPSGSLKKEKTY